MKAGREGWGGKGGGEDIGCVRQREGWRRSKMSPYDVHVTGLDGVRESGSKGGRDVRMERGKVAVVEED